jgi:hypothetical protein
MYIVVGMHRGLYTIAVLLKCSSKFNFSLVIVIIVLSLIKFSIKFNFLL